MVWIAVAFVVFLALYNNVTNLAPPPRWTYVPLNLLVAGGLVLAARSAGLTWNEIGLRPHEIGPSLRWGGGLAALVAVGLAVALVLPAAERPLADGRVAALDGAGVAYAALVRVPFGTVALEEIAFRGVLFGVGSRLTSTVVAAAVSSAVFGLWHVGPTIELLRANDVAASARRRTVIVAGSVAVTALAGMGLVWLRLRTGGILAGVIVHAATNSLATVAAYASLRRKRLIPDAPLPRSRTG